MSPDVAQTKAKPSASRDGVLGPVAAFIAFVVELTLVPLLLPAIQAQFGLSTGALTWVFNAYGTAVAVGVLFGGWLGDKFDIHRIFAAGVACFAAGALTAANASSFEGLLLGRALQGLGAGIFSPLVPILLTRAAPQEPGKVLIFWGSVAGYVAAFAPFVYASVLSGYQWHTAFNAMALIVLLGFAALRRPSAMNAQSKAEDTKANFSEIFRSRHLWLTYGYVFCTYGSITFCLFQLPIWMSSKGLDPAGIGLLLSCLWLTFSGASTLLRNKVDGPNIRLIMISAPIMIALGYPLSYFTDSPWLLALSAVLIGAGLACSNAPSTQLVLRFAPQGLKAISTSFDITFARLGGIATVAFLAEQPFLSAVFATIASCLIAGLCAAIVSRKYIDVISSTGSQSGETPM